LGQPAEAGSSRLELALKRSAQGDSAAFAELVREHQSMVFSIAYHYLQDRSLAEDLAQEVFLELYQGLDRIESPAHLTFWLRRVTANRCIDQGRKKLRRSCWSDCSRAWPCCRRDSAWS
jgi:DNA-directed RNA polymerase specialized sigma24 family protein